MTTSKPANRGGPEDPNANVDALAFRVDASVVFQLGRDLITDHAQAVIELIKNCYDANASYANVTIQTDKKAQTGLKSSLFPDAVGYVRIDDDGDGMSSETIRNAWLVLSNSPKRKIKERDQLPARPPLGDKGLGRLSSQRLGQNLEIVTKTRGRDELSHVGVSWLDFQSGDLARVPVRKPGTVDAMARATHGTTVFISDLTESDVWSGKTRLGLQSRLTRLISPFDPPKDFTIAIELDGEAVDLAEVPERLRNEADIVFSFVYAEGVLRIKGRARLRSLRPVSRRVPFDAQTSRDHGRGLLEHLCTALRGPIGARPSRNKGWFVEFGAEQLLAKLPEVDLLPADLKKPKAKPKPADPGPFKGELNSFSLNASRRPEVESSHFTWDEYRTFVIEQAGIRVYRDGFGIKVDTDFLGLGKQQTVGASWYGLRPGNTVGYINLSVKENRQLIETTDREGFKETPHYRNFEKLLGVVVKFAGEALDHLRRETIDYCDKAVRKQAAVPADASTGQVAQLLSQELSGAPRYLKVIGASRTRVAEAHAQLDELAAGADRDLRQSLKALGRTFSTASKAVTQVESILSRIARLNDRFSVLHRQIETFEDRLARTYEAVSIGLTVEAFAHEVSNVTTRLADQSATISRHLQEASSADRKVAAYVRHVQSAVSAIRKQLAHLEPSLRYVRERRTSIPISVFLSEQSEHHAPRLKAARIDLCVEIEEDFVLKVNRGKLTQVIDNLLLNSEYWLREALRTEEIDSGSIKIIARAPWLRIEDNGRGIEPRVESTLFQPFVTTKPGGRGLGLFVSRELLRSEGCDIRVADERNGEGNFYAFELDLSGIIDGQGKEQEG